MRSPQWLVKHIAETSRAVRRALLFLQIAFQIGTRPRITAEKIANRHEAMGLGAKLFASIGVTLWLLSLNTFDPKSKDTWLDVFLQMQRPDETKFLTQLHLSWDDFDDNVAEELNSPGNAPLSRQITDLSGSNSINDIIIFLSRHDSALAKRFSKAAEVSAFKSRIADSVIAIVRIPFYILGGIVFHLLASRRTKPLAESVKLTLYYLGYAGLVNSTLTLAIAPFSTTNEWASAGSKLFDASMSIVLNVQYGFFMNGYHRRPFLIATIGLVAALTTYWVCNWIAARLLVLVLDSPLFETLAERFA